MSEIPTNDEPVFSLNSVGIGTCEWAVTERTMQWDSQMHVLFGLEPGLFSGRYDDFLALVDSSDRDRLTREIATGLGEGGDFGCGLQIALPSTPATRSLEMRFKVRPEAENEARYIMVFCWDVRECHRITEALVSEQHLLSALMNNLPD